MDSRVALPPTRLAPKNRDPVRVVIKADDTNRDGVRDTTALLFFGGPLNIAGSALMNNSNEVTTLVVERTVRDYPNLPFARPDSNPKELTLRRRFSELFHWVRTRIRHLASRRAHPGTLAPVSPMPEPGDPCPGFVAQPGECWQMIYDGHLQATHCRETPCWTGRWFSPKGGDRWWRVWACPDHIEGLTGLREFGRRSD